MNKKDYISNVFRKILNEDLEERAESLMNKLNYNKTLKLNKDKEFDYVQEEKSMCNECGGMMTEGECSECGYTNEELIELGGMDDGHPRFGNKNLSKMSKREKDMLMGDRDYEDSFEDDIDYGNTKYGLGDDDDEEEYYPELRIPSDMPSHKTKYRYSDDEDDFEDFEDLDIETDWSELEEDELDEKLYGKQHKIDRNKNNRIDAGDFKMLRKQQDEEEQLYEVEFEKEIEEGETEEGNAFTGALANAKKKGDDEFEVDGKKYNVKESILYTESDLIDLIESIVKEEKKKFSTKEPKGYKEYERAHKADKKENDDYLKSVAKKMSDYLKGSSDSGSKYEMKETEKFPTENGGLKKGIRKKYTPSDAVDDYEDAFSYPGMTNLVFDEIKPNEKNIEKYLKGHKTTGNAQVDDDGKALGNVVPSEVGDKFFQNFKDNLYGQEQMDASYKRQPQPVDQAGEDTERGSLKSKRGKKTSQSVLNKVDEGVNEKEVKKLNEEFERIQNLMGYSRKTQ
jgi:hypothetical protein